MKARCFGATQRAFTLTELLLIIVTVILIACFVIPGAARQQCRARARQCENNLKYVGLAFRTWPVGASDQFPAQIMTTAGGTMELIDTGQVFVHFRAMSNELGSPKILVCPRDSEKVPVTNFNTGFNDTNVSYFVATDAMDTYPQMFLSGDRNLAFNSKPLGPRLFKLTTNYPPLSWTKSIHNSCGNILLADGSVQFTDSKALSLAAQNQGFPTNRLAIP